MYSSINITHNVYSKSFDIKLIQEFKMISYFRELQLLKGGSKNFYLIYIILFL